MEPRTYLVVDGENIDATLGISVLDRKPSPEERPRWDRILQAAGDMWNQPAKGLFFLNASSGHLPLAFVQALLAMHYSPIPLSGPATIKVVDVGIMRMLDEILLQPSGDVILASHDGDFLPQVSALLEAGRKVAMLAFPEFLSSHFHDLIPLGLQVFDLEHDVNAFQVALPRLQIIDVNDFDPKQYL